MIAASSFFSGAGGGADCAVPLPLPKKMLIPPVQGQLPQKVRIGADAPRPAVGTRAVYTAVLNRRRALAGKQKYFSHVPQFPKRTLETSFWGIVFCAGCLL